MLFFYNTLKNKNEEVFFFSVSNVVCVIVEVVCVFLDLTIKIFISFSKSFTSSREDSNIVYLSDLTTFFCVLKNYQSSFLKNTRHILSQYYPQHHPSTYNRSKILIGPIGSNINNAWTYKIFKNIKVGCDLNL